MEKTNLSNNDFEKEQGSVENLNPEPGSVDLRQRVPDLLFCLGLDTNEKLREAGFDDSQIQKIYTAVRQSPCFISINFNLEPLDIK